MQDKTRQGTTRQEKTRHGTTRQDKTRPNETTTVLLITTSRLRSVLSRLVSSCLVLSCLVLSCLVLSCLVLPCLVLSCLVLPYLVLSWVLSCLLVLSCLALPCLVLSCLTLCLVLSHDLCLVFVLSRLVLSVLQALFTLQTQMRPLVCFHDEILELSMLLLCASLDDIKALTQWEGTVDSARQRLVDQLQSLLCRSLYPPPGRLEQLISQGLELQRKQSVYHNQLAQARLPEQLRVLAPPTSLFEDYCPTHQSLPHRSTHVLEEHKDEVWVVRFSRSGALLASASQDLNVIVWKVTYNDTRTFATEVLMNRII
jgi:hypothetical protein